MKDNKAAMRFKCHKTATIFSLLIAAVVSSAQNKTMIALGDSVAWGYQPNDVTRSAGDKGYVKLVADWVGTQQGGVRPKLINLAIPGESTTSFYDTSEIGGFLNNNYPIFGRKSQAQLFVDKVNAETAAGRVVTHVTFALGANDLLDLLTTQFLALPFPQQTAIADQALHNAQAKLSQELALVRQYCPNAKIVIPGYYNPYGAYPGSAEDLIGVYSIPKLNHILQVLGKRSRAPFASTYELFLGHELAWTWIGEDDVHPRDPGYTNMGSKVINRFINSLDTVGP